VQVVASFPRAVRDVENVWIPLKDGTRLAARLWLPVDAEKNPVPAILEYIPYRKRDFMRARDEGMHPYFAGHGYAAVRLDIRGSGESDGLPLDEYVKQEQDDALEAIAWIAAQPWCSGAVGMIGKSWGGFNGLQVAARRPPALKAVITLMSTDDRYADDVHYMGGCLLNDNLGWGAVMTTFNARPPDPAIVGEGWREQWLARLDAAPLLSDIWLSHQRRDAYWKHGSVCEDYGAIQCPVYAIGGWADGYSDAVFRLMAGLTVPRKGLVGPWAHLYPQDGVPGPAIGFLQEALRWWDQWLKGIDTGIAREPMLRVWQQDSVAPRTYYEERPGRWVAEALWPSPRIEPRRYAMNADGLGAKAGPEAALTLASPQDVGRDAGDFSGFAVPGDLPGDQREDDGGSLVFDSNPLAQPLAILGGPVVELDLAVDRPQALVAVRLSDVSPDGAATRVTYGVLNLSHRDGHEADVKPMTPGRRTKVRIALHDAGHRFAAGHRIRLAVSTAYWPLVWPSPQPVTLTLHAGACALELPVRPADEAGDAALAPFAEPQMAPPTPATALKPGRFERSVRRDLATGESVYRILADGGVFKGAALVRLDAIDLAIGHRIDRVFRIRPDDPLSARQEIEHVYVMERGAWRIRVVARLNMRCDATAFHTTATLDAYEGEARVFSREWSKATPRDHV